MQDERPSNNREVFNVKIEIKQLKAKKPTGRNRNSREKKTWKNLHNLFRVNYIETIKRKTRMLTIKK